MRALCLTPIVFILSVFASPAWAGTDIKRDEVGAFVIESEHWTRDGVPIMHSPSETKQVRLLWTSSDGRVAATLEDDGYTVQYRYTAQTSEKSSCLVQVGLFAIGPMPSDGKFWAAQLDSFDVAMKDCSEMSRTDIANYQVQMRAALSDAPAAFDLWKKRSAEWFSSSRRCLELEQSFDPFFRPCKTYSDENQ